MTPGLEKNCASCYSPKTGTGPNRKCLSYCTNRNRTDIWYGTVVSRAVQLHKNWKCCQYSTQTLTGLVVWFAQSLVNIKHIIYVVTYYQTTRTKPTSTIKCEVTKHVGTVLNIYNNRRVATTQLGLLGVCDYTNCHEGLLTATLMKMKYIRNYQANCIAQGGRGTSKQCTYS